MPYEPDLAYIHDDGFGNFARMSAPWILETLKSAGITNGLVVDLGCGSGIWATILLDKGYDALGFDISPAMIKLAQKQAPAARFKTVSFFEADIPPCRAVTSLGESLNYLFDTSQESASLTRLFGRVHAALESGGIFVFDFLESDYKKNTNPGGRMVEQKNWSIWFEISERNKTIERQIVAFRKVGKLYRRSEETHRLRLLEPSQIVKQLRRIGFAVQTFRGYGDFRFRPGHRAVVAKKR